MSLTHFTQTDNKPYNRHRYQLVDVYGESVTFDTWEEAQMVWFQSSQLGNLSHINVIDKVKNKGFKVSNLQSSSIV